MRKIQIAGYGIESAELPEDVEALEAQGENLEEATEALEAFALLLQPAVEGYAVNPAALEAVAAITNRLVRKAGLPTLAVGTESLVVDTVQQAASLGLEDIKEHLKNAGKAITAFLEKIFNFIKEKLNQASAWLSGNVDKLIKLYEDLKDDLHDKKFEFPTKRFYVNGKLSKDVMGDLKNSVDALNSLQLKSLNDIVTSLGRITSSARYEQSALVDQLSKHATDAYRECDKAFKFDKNTQLSTVLITGGATVSVAFDETASKAAQMLQVDVKRIDDEKSSLTLKGLGLNPTDIKTLKEPLDALVSKNKAFSKQNSEDYTFFTKTSSEIANTPELRPYHNSLMDATKLYSKICSVRLRAADAVVYTVQSLIQVANILKKEA